MQPWVKRNEEAEKAALAAREAAAAHVKISAELEEAKKALAGVARAAEEPQRARDLAEQALAEATIHVALFEEQLESARSHLAAVEAEPAEARPDAAPGSVSGGRTSKRGTAEAQPAETASDAGYPRVATADDRLEHARARVERAKDLLKEAFEQLLRFRQKRDDAVEAAGTAENALRKAAEQVGNLTAKKSDAAATAWESRRLADAASQALGQHPAMAELKRDRTPPAFLRITSPTSRLEPAVERALRLLESSDRRLQPAASLDEVEKMLQAYALAGSIQKVTERLNRMKLTPARRRLLALSYLSTLVEVFTELEQELGIMGPADRKNRQLRQIVRERVDDLVGFSNTILLHQERVIHPLLADGVVDDVGRVRRLSFPDAGAARLHVIDRVTARL